MPFGRNNLRKSAITNKAVKCTNKPQDKIHKLKLHFCRRLTSYSGRLGT